MSEEKEQKLKEYGKNRYHNMSEEKKIKRKRISKKIPRSQKNLIIIINKIVHVQYLEKLSEIKV